MKFFQKFSPFSFFFLPLLFLFSFHYSFAETDINGDEIANDTTWTADAGPYIIYQTPTVDAGVTLTIEPGTIIKFDSGQSINISGSLIAQGSADNPIYFTSINDDSVGGNSNLISFDSDGDGIDDTTYDPAPDYGDWRGINISASGSYDIENATVAYANTAINATSATGTINSAYVAHGQYGFVFQNDSQASIKNLNMDDMLSGGIVLLASNASISASTIQNIVGGYAINDLNGSSLDLENSTLKNISNTAFLLYSASTASINNSTITDSGGIEAYQNSNFTFENSTMKNVSGWITNMDSSSATIQNSSVDTADSGIQASDHSSVDIENSTIENITNGGWAAFALYNNSTTTIADSDIENVSASSVIQTFNGGSLTLSNSTLSTMTGIALEAYTGAWSGYGSTTVMIASSTISEGESDGFQIYGMVNANITDSTISNFIGDGLRTFSYPIINISGSTITGTQNGIENYGANVSVSNSTIANNATFGITNNPAESGAPSILAENNWWGDPSGPFNIDTNATGTANTVSDNVDFTPWLTSRPGAKPSCCSNVLFIPGLEASRLYEPDYNGGTTDLWEPGIFRDTSKLLLDANGESVGWDIYTKDIIDNAYVPVIGNVYASFIASMDKMKSAGTINDWSAAPYDWRLSLNEILNNGRLYPDGRIYYSGDNATTSSPYIITELRALAASSQTGKVTIIAHSNGGLVTKALTDALGPDASKLIDKIIFVAVPEVGTPSAIGGILHGFGSGIPSDSFPAFFSPDDARELAQNMPSAYNLLPSADYFSSVSDPVITFDNSDFLASWRAKYGNDISTEDGLKNFMNDQSRSTLPVTDPLVFPTSANETLLDSAEMLHDDNLDKWTPPAGIALTEIAGWGIDTLKTIEYKEGWNTVCDGIQIGPLWCTHHTTTPVLIYDPVPTTDGDGTVVIPSALWTAIATTSEKYWVNLRDYGASGLFGSTIDRKHADILEIPELRTFIQNIIMNSSDSLPKYISTSTPIDPNPENRLNFILHSPLYLGVYDDDGNYTGFSTTTNQVEENIPDSDYETYGEVTEISVPASSTAHVIMQGYSSGSFTFDIEEAQGDTIIASTTFAGIPSSTSTIATIDIPAGGNIASSSPLVVDENGDGSADMTLSPVLDDTVIPDFATTTPVSDISQSSDGNGAESSYFAMLAPVQSVAAYILPLIINISSSTEKISASASILIINTDQMKTPIIAKIIKTGQNKPIATSSITQSIAGTAVVGNHSISIEVLLILSILAIIVIIGIRFI